MWTDRQTDSGALWSIAVHCKNVVEGLQTIVVHYVACGACIAPCGGVHHILSHLAIIAVRYGNVTESSGTTGMLAGHCDALQCIAVHCGASSICCGRVHHTLTEMPNSIPLSIIRLIHKSSQPTHSMRSTCLYPTDTTFPL